MRPQASGREPVVMLQGRQGSKRDATKVRHQQPLPFQAIETPSSRLIPESLQLEKLRRITLADRQLIVTKMKKPERNYSGAKIVRLNFLEVR
jgi:hypothetical protein